jgi:hypothetical protein
MAASRPSSMASHRAIGGTRNAATRIPGETAAPAGDSGADVSDLWTRSGGRGLPVGGPRRLSRLNQRTSEGFESRLREIGERLADSAHAAPFGVNLIVHRSNSPLAADLPANGAGLTLLYDVRMTRA